MHYYLNLRFRNLPKALMPNIQIDVGQIKMRAQSIFKPPSLLKQQKYGKLFFCPTTTPFIGTIRNELTFWSRAAKAPILNISYCNIFGLYSRWRHDSDIKWFISNLTPSMLPANWFLAKLPCVSWFASALHGLVAVTIFRTAPGQGSTHVAILTTPTRIASGKSFLLK